jgi:hypothetical protein
MEVPRGDWRWRLRLAVPRDVGDAQLTSAIQVATSRRGGKLEGSAAAAQVTLERIAAARVGRVLHIGPYANERQSFAKILSAIEAAGLAPRHAHIEVYLSDPRRTAPAKLRTILLMEIDDGGQKARRTSQ